MDHCESFAGDEEFARIRAVNISTTSAGGMKEAKSRSSGVNQLEGGSSRSEVGTLFDQKNVPQESSRTFPDGTWTLMFGT